MAADKDLTFEISLSVLDHLGRNLYRSFATVLGEAISNSWDADADNVWINIDENQGSFLVKDDGDGMTFSDFQNKFLKIGYSKRHGGETRSSKGRPYIGRKESGSSYKSVYGRMAWNALSPTITTEFYNYGSGRFGHPEQDRAISIREGALLQTFPPEYEFVPEGQPIYFETAGRWIGNAVPVKLAENIGLSIIKSVKDANRCSRPE